MAKRKGVKHVGENARRYLHLLDQYGQNYTWFRMPRAFLKITESFAAAIVLAHLLNIASTKARLEREEFRDNEGWFRCSAKSISDLLGKGDRTQSRIVIELEEAGFIATEMRSNDYGSSRWIFVDTLAIDEAVMNNETTLEM